MTQLNKLGGNAVLPLTAHFGFGVPDADDASTGPRVIVVDGNPGGLPAPVGSLALDYATPTLWQSTGSGTWSQVTPSAQLAGDTLVLQHFFDLIPFINGVGVFPSDARFDVQDLGGGPLTVQISAESLQVGCTGNGNGAIVVGRTSPWLYSADPVNGNLEGQFLIGLANAALTSARVEAGFKDSPLINFGADDGGGDPAMFIRFDPAGPVSSTNWVAVFDDGNGTLSLVDTGVLAVLNAAPLIEFSLFSATLQATCSINGVVVATGDFSGILNQMGIAYSGIQANAVAGNSYLRTFTWGLRLPVQ